MRPRPPTVLLTVSLALAGPPLAARGQLVPSPRPAPLPPVEAVDGPLALTIVYPRADAAPLPDVDSTFLFGSTGSGRASLTINGTAVAVAPDGAFLAWLPLPDDTVAVFHLVARRDDDTDSLDWRLRVRRPRVPPAQVPWLDPATLAPRGNRWAETGELVRVTARASPSASVAVVLPDGRTFPLVPDTTSAAPYGPFEREPGRFVARAATRFVGAVPAVPLGAPLPPLTGTSVPVDTLGGWAVAAVVASSGADTVRTALPLRLSLVNPQALPVVVLDDDTARTGTSRGSVVGSPSPRGTYYWFFLNGTRVALDGRAGDQLRVRLSATSVAWVSLADVGAVLPAGTPPPAARLRLVRLTPRDSSVEARFSLGTRAPFRVDEDDRSITVRLYGTVSDLDFVQYGGTDPLVRRVTWAQSEADECTVTFELAAPVFGWRTRWEGNDAVLEIRRPPLVDPAHPLAGRTIAVDPGHPPEGATGPTGLREADANLAVAMALKGLLEREGARVVMTRTTDTALGLYERTAIAEHSNAEILVSIHQNALPDGVNPYANNGTSTYYFHPRSARLAVLTQRALVGELGLRDLGVARGDFALVRPTWMPAILTEGAFIMLPEQESALRSPSFQETYARGIALGIQAYLRELAGRP
jgi:N-acetylmuramoyl-L-alanine amidase